MDAWVTVVFVDLCKYEVSKQEEEKAGRRIDHPVENEPRLLMHFRTTF